MRTRIVQLDVARGIHPVPVPEGYDAVLLVVRRGRTPLGVVRVAPGDGERTLPVHRVEALLRGRLGIRSPSAQGVRPRSIPPTTLRPGISVVVCTRDRPELLERCLEALSGVEYPRFEVVVVDSASTGGRTAEIVGATPFRYAREARPGLNRARNRGAAEARYEIVAFTDDDALADPGWLEGIAEGFAAPGVDAVTGLVLPEELETPAQHLFEAYGGGMSKGLAGREFRAGELLWHERIAVQAMGVGANMAFRRSTLDALGGFDPALDVGTPARGGGDLDLFHRLVAAGMTLRYEPSALVWHRHRPGMGELRRQLFDNGCSYGVYLQKLWRTGEVPRREMFGFVLLRWAPWLVGRLARGVLGRHPLPLSLLWAEVRGALHAPRAYRAAFGGTATEAVAGTEPALPDS